MRLRSRDGRTLHVVGGTQQAPGPAARPPSEGPRQPIGIILLEMGAISQENFSRVMAEQQRTGQLFGEIAQRMGLVSPELVQRAIERQQNFHVLRPGDPRVDPLVVAAFQPTDPLSQAVRELRGSVSAARRTDGVPVRSVSLIGIEASVEATLLSANLGVAFAQAGYRTLLVDTNLGSPVQNRLFSASNRIGVSGLLSTEGDERAAIQDSAIANLSLLTTGPDVPNAMELFDRGRLYQRLRPLSDAFDMVVVDASAGDGAAIAASEGIDATILVVRRNVTSLKTVRRTAEWLASRGTLMLGSIITG